MSANGHGQNIAQAATNACTSCSRGKRRCDRATPRCSTCIRFGRDCVYEGRPAQNSRQGVHHAAQIPLNHGNAHETFAVDPVMGLLVGDLNHGIDGHAGHSLSKEAVDRAVRLQVFKIIGSNLQAIQDLAALFFDSIYVKITFLAKGRFLDRLSGGIEEAPADFAALCLCLSLILQRPTPGTQNMQTPHYVIVKNIISLLESTGYYLTLDHIQCRLFVIFYEIGHDIFPAASVSIGACARMARALGLSQNWHRPIRNELGEVIVEEGRRAWWAIYNLDRFANLCSADAVFATEEPRVVDLLPIEDARWFENDIPDAVFISIGSPSDFAIGQNVGQFARECQASFLAGKVLRHVVEPISDLAFYQQEEAQLERTLKAFSPILVEEDTKYGQYCSALAICTSTMFALYHAAINSPDDNPLNKLRVTDSMKANSIRIAQFATHIFLGKEEVDIDILSPINVHCLYLAAIVEFQAWKESKEVFSKRRFYNLKDVIAIFARRWLVAVNYVNALVRLEAEA